MHHIFNFIFYDHLTPLSHQFALSMSFISIPNSYEKALMYPEWKQVIDEEMDALISCQTWDIVTTLSGLHVVLSLCVYNQVSSR